MKISPSKELHPQLSFLPINTHMHTQSSVQQPAAMARRTATDHRKQQQRVLQQSDANNHDGCEDSCSVCPLLQHRGPLL